MHEERSARGGSRYHECHEDLSETLPAMNSRGHPQYQPFPKLEEPWPYYSPQSRRVLSPPPKPRFPYSVPVGGHAQMGYVPASVARHAPAGYRGYASSPAPSPYSRTHDYPSAERHARISVPRHYPDEDVDGDPVVYNAGFTFRMGKESTVHKHLEVQPLISSLSLPFPLFSF